MRHVHACEGGGEGGQGREAVYTSRPPGRPPIRQGTRHTISTPFHTHCLTLDPLPPHRFTLDLVQRPLLEEGFVQLQRQTLPGILLTQVAEAAEANQRVDTRLPIRRGGLQGHGGGAGCRSHRGTTAHRDRLPSRGRGRGKRGSLAACSFASLEGISEAVSLNAPHSTGSRGP